MANHEDYLDALTAFGRNNSKEIPPILDQYLNGVAKNGETLFQWPLLKPLIVGKLEQVFEELHQRLASENITPRPNVENVGFDIMKTRIMDAVHRFTGAPFTIQRLCELLSEPRRHYVRSDKFMRGLEKNVLVVSTVDPFGRKVVSEGGNKHLVNGMDNGSPFLPRDSSISSSLPPVPGWVTTSASTPVSAPRTHGSPKKYDNQDALGGSNGVGSSLVSPMFGDQEDQPPAVHAEEVVETALSVEACDVGPEATGAGEAMAEEDEEMGTEDTNASTSSSSSSSSSSEDLSTSDPGDSLTNVANPAPTVSSSSELKSGVRSWASDSSDENARPTDESMEHDSGQSEPEASKTSDSGEPASTDAVACLSDTQMDTTAAAPQSGQEAVSAGVETTEVDTTPSSGQEKYSSVEDTSSSTAADAENVCSYTEVSSEVKSPNSDTHQGEVVDCRDENTEEVVDTPPVVEPPPSATVTSVTSSESSSLSSSSPHQSSSPPEQHELTNQSSSHSTVEDTEKEEGEPRCKHRRLSTEESSSDAHHPSSLASNESSTHQQQPQQDSEQPSSSTTTPSSTEVSSDAPAHEEESSGTAVSITSEALPSTTEQGYTTPAVIPTPVESTKLVGGGDGHTTSASSEDRKSGSSQESEQTVETCGDVLEKVPLTDATENVLQSEPMKQD